MDEELDSLDEAFRKDEEEHAAKRLFEQSKLWAEHRKWHEEQGTPAQLLVWEEDRPLEQPKQVVAEDVPVKVQHIKVGGCECQPKFALMQLEDKGDVVPGIPAPIEEAKTYNATSSATTSYNSQAPAGNVYNSQTNNVYRQQ